MKKLFLFLFGLLSLGLFLPSADAGNYELVKLDDGAKVYVRIDKKSGNKYRLNAEVKNSDKKYNALSCEILLPNNDLIPVGACNGAFNYQSRSKETVKIYIKMNDEYDTIQKKYDFDDGEWTDGKKYDFDEDDDDDNDNDNYGDADNFDIDTDDKSPEKNEWVDVTLTIRDNDDDTVKDYYNTIKYNVEYRTSSRSSWKTASSSYYEIDDDYDNNDEIKFKKSWDGKKEFRKFIKFKREYEFRLTFEDDNDSDIDGDIKFDVGDNNDDDDNSGDADNFDIDTNDKSPDKNEWVDVTLTVRDDDDDTVKDYNNTVKYNVEYRTSSNSSWRTASSSYYEIDDDYDNDDEIEFRNSWDGEKKFSDFIKFKREYEFRLSFEDEDDSDIDGDIKFDVGDNKDDDDDDYGDADNFDIDTDDKSPKKNEKVDITLTVRDDDNDTVKDYNNTIKYDVEYKKSSNSSWKDASHSYYEVLDNDYDDGEIKFKKSWDGEKKFSNFIKFKKEKEFRLTFKDEDDKKIKGDIKFDVGDNNDDDDDNSGDADSIDAKISDNTPKEDKWVDVTLKIKDDDKKIVDDYDNTIIYQVQYKKDGDWEVAKDSYYKVDKDYADEKIKFKKSWDGEKKFSDFIKFKKEKEFMVVFADEDDDDIYGYVKANVGGTSIGTYDDYYDAPKGFSNSERTFVKKVDKILPILVEKFKIKYPKLTNDYLWNIKTKKFKDNLSDLVSLLNKESNREFKSYKDFNKGFMEWAEYTAKAVR